MRLEFPTAASVTARLAVAVVAFTVTASGCGGGAVRALALVPRNEPLHRLSIRLTDLDNDAELAVRDGGRVTVRLVGADPDPERWDVRINGACGLSYGPTDRQLVRRGPGGAEAIYDFDWPGLAAAHRLTVVVHRPDVELRYVWRFAD